MTPHRKPLAAALGAALALGASGAQAASLFQVADLGAGYQVAFAGEAKTADAKPAAEAKAAAAKTADATAKAGDKAAAKKAELACGEGKCGAMTTPKTK